jgi:hypothetical protein
MHKAILLWIMIVSGLIAAMGICVGCSRHVSPSTFIPCIIIFSLLAYCTMNVQDRVMVIILSKPQTT